ncbi:hypothetical protein PCANC_04948 [Puccinia coronata f. sp. avenae]|uniref:Uncharacterized protein n=1 Tax=Puccinia coronata f. sp. avenae TaxID=200324 RepID=A0A2N5TG96_9BASI|nr:hypothetical protein PCASD_07467 [Puccinia coronata f. sp. avenae]PLW54377.1 hypothetical protein PCANC_04948 [Puccinia coronata f. sp. avenae]
MSYTLNYKTNNRSDYGSSSRSKVPPAPLNLPSIHLLLQLADSPAPIPQQTSLTLPPLRLSNPFPDHRPFFSPGPSSASSCSSTRASSSSTRASSPHSSENPREYPRPAKRKQVKRACLQRMRRHPTLPEMRNSWNYRKLHRRAEEIGPKVQRSGKRLMSDPSHRDAKPLLRRSDLGGFVRLESLDFGNIWIPASEASVREGKL